MNFASAETRKQAQWFHLVLPLVALVLLIALRPRLPTAIRVSAALALIASSLYIMLVYTCGFEDNYGTGSTLFGLVVGGTATLVLLTDPMVEVRYVRDPDPSPLAARPLYQRTWIAACLLCNLRCVGTNFTVLSMHSIARHIKLIRLDSSQVTAHSTAPFRGPRRAWYTRQGLRLLSAYLINDICETWITLNRHIYPPSLVGPPTHVVPEDLEMWKRGLGAFAFGSRIYATLTIDSIVLSVVTVALGMHSPEDWPDLFGSIFHAYTVRRFWGCVSLTLPLLLRFEQAMQQVHLASYDAARK